MLDFYPSILQNSSKVFSLSAVASESLFGQIVPPNIVYPMGLDGYKFDASKRVLLNPSQYMKAGNLYFFHKWKVSHNLNNPNLDVYSANGSSSWMLWNEQNPMLDSSMPFSDTQENEMLFAFKPNTNNPKLSVSFAGLFDNASADFLDVVQMRISLRFTVYEISNTELVNEWLSRSVNL